VAGAGASVQGFDSLRDMKPLPISSRQFGKSSDFFHTIFPQEVSFSFRTYLEANYKNCVNNKGLKKIRVSF